MDTETNRTAEPPAARAVVTEFYAGLNHFVADRGERSELAATLTDDVRWTVVADGDRSARSYTGVDAVVENVATPARVLAAHLQALPERFTEADDRVVVEGAYVGTVDDTEFEIAFVHVHDLDDDLIRRCRAYVDTARERRVFGPY